MINININLCFKIEMECIVPKYDFLCSKGCTYESEESFGSSREQKCQKCKKGTAIRQLNVPTFRYRGMGFYTTDTRKDSRKPEVLPETSARNEAPPEQWPEKDDTLHGKESSKQSEKKQSNKSSNKSSE
jgi:predicted nucleic acid-binding Zn ribbon protein